MRAAQQSGSTLEGRIGHSRSRTQGSVGGGECCTRCRDVRRRRPRSGGQSRQGTQAGCCSHEDGADAEAGCGREVATRAHSQGARRSQVGFAISSHTGAWCSRAVGDELAQRASDLVCAGRGPLSRAGLCVGSGRGPGRGYRRRVLPACSGSWLTPREVSVT